MIAEDKPGRVRSRGRQLQQVAVMMFVRGRGVTFVSASLFTSAPRFVRRFATAVSVVGAVVLLTVGCSAQPPQTPPTTANSATAQPNSPASVTSQIDPRWMGLGTTQLWNWELIDREITPNFQQFGVRPLLSTEVPRVCNGCGGQEAATAILTAFAPGKFDPTDARSGQPVNVNGREGFFRPSVGVEDAVLTWSYADDAWATVHGRTPDTSELDTMVELAGDLRPTERTPVRLPLSMANVPAAMPLSSITAQHGRWPTMVRFDACPRSNYRAPAPKCADTTDSLSVQIWPNDHFFETFKDDDVPTFHDDAVPITIGGKDGLYDKTSNRAAARIRPRMVVEFELSDPRGGPAPTTNLEDILNGVVWASDPGNEATWPAVSDWAK